jgi:hypothetical protein
MAMKDHVIIPNNAMRHVHQNWRPQIYKGSATGQSMDSVMFRKSNGFYSFILDDDNCYCHTMLEMGYSMCQGSVDHGRFGIDLADNGCGKVGSGQNDKRLYLFWRKRASPIRGSMGVGWTKFWHFQPRQGRKRDMLEHKFGACKKKDGKVEYEEPVCTGRMPTDLSEKDTELLAIDWNANVYKWKFNPNINTAKHTYKAFTQGRSGTGRIRHLHGQNWKASVLRGSITHTSQDSFNYVECCGTWSFILDDDGCYCHTTLEAGSRICSSGNCNSCTYGVDFIRDQGCGHVANGGNRGLTMWYRDCSKEGISC